MCSIYMKARGIIVIYYYTYCFTFIKFNEKGGRRDKIYYEWALFLLEYVKKDVMNERGVEEDNLMLSVNLPVYFV